jgi:hypothetical protein
LEKKVMSLYCGTVEGIERGREINKLSAEKLRVDVSPMSTKQRLQNIVSKRKRGGRVVTAAQGADNSMGDKTIILRREDKSNSRSKSHSRLDSEGQAKPKYVKKLISYCKRSNNIGVGKPKDNGGSASGTGSQTCHIKRMKTGGEERERLLTQNSGNGSHKRLARVLSQEDRLIAPISAAQNISTHLRQMKTPPREGSYITGLVRKLIGNVSSKPSGFYSPSHQQVYNEAGVRSRKKIVTGCGHIKSNRSSSPKGGCASGHRG